MAYSRTDFLSWEEDIDLDNLLGEYTADESDGTNAKLTPDVIYVCPECNKEYKSISGFRGHALKKHDKSLKASNHRKGQKVSDQPMENDFLKFQGVFPRAYMKSVENLKTNPIYNIFDNTEAIIAAACEKSPEAKKYFFDFMSDCFKGNRISTSGEREQFFQTVHQKRTDKQLIYVGVSLLECIVSDCDSADIVNFIQSFVLDLIGEVVSEMKRAEMKVSHEEQLSITDSDNSILFYIAGFIIKALQNKYSRRKNKIDKEKCLSDVQSLTSQTSAKSFTDKYSVWYQRKNRGGLQKPCDDFFLLIREFERLIRASLNTEKGMIKERVLESYMVQHYTEKLYDTSTCVYVEDALEIFLSVRGYARARAEQRKYKKETVKDNRGKTSSSLRGVLKSVSNN